MGLHQGPALRTENVGTRQEANLKEHLVGFFNGRYEECWPVLK